MSIKTTLLKRLEVAEKKMNSKEIPDLIMIYWVPEKDAFKIQETYMNESGGSQKELYMPHYKDYVIVKDFKGQIIIDLQSYDGEHKLYSADAEIIRKDCSIKGKDFTIEKVQNAGEQAMRHFNITTIDYI